jgi:hypothetical protein
VDWHHPKEDLVKFGYRSEKQVGSNTYSGAKPHSKMGKKKMGKEAPQG